jgi:alpha-tubulin suppressor-like RCC1 family protein
LLLQSEEGKLQCSTYPVLVRNTHALDVAQVAVAADHAALLTRGGEMYTWGDGAGGKLGHGMLSSCSQPQQVGQLFGKGVVEVACGRSYTAAVLPRGELYVWGSGRGGQLGLGEDRQASLWPTRVLGGLSEVRVEHISCGSFHAAAVSASGHLFTWGDGSFGKLGHGDHVTCYSPRPVEAVGDMWVISLSCGWWHTAMAAVPRSSMPALPPGGSLSRQASSSSGIYQQADALRRSSSSGGGMLARSPSPGLLFGGHLFTWGGDFGWSEPGGKVDHHQGCLGHGDLQGRCLPTKVKGEDDVCAVACGQNFTIALTTTGYVLQMGKTGANPGE